MREEKESGTGSYKIVWWHAYAVLVIGLSALMFTGVPVIGKLTFASEVEHVVKQEVKKEIAQLEAKLGGIEGKVAGVETKVSAVEVLVKEQVLETLMSGICRYSVRRSKEIDFDERQRLLQQINEMKNKYRRFAQADFNMSDC